MDAVCNMTGEATTWPCQAPGCPLFGDCLSEHEGNSKPPMTNADRIRAMSDEELAREIYSMQKTMCTRFAEIVGFKKEELNFSEDAPDILNWLRQTAEED